METTLLKTGTQFLYPGMLFAEPGSFSVSTVLGSCVSVCLWDPVMRMGGINHYLLPFWNGEGLRTPRYGNIAIPLLLEKLLEAGCLKCNIKAKVFGGAKVLEQMSGVLNIGDRNITYAESALSEANIPVVGRDVGGTSGRKLLYLTGTGEVFVRKLGKTQA